MKRPHTWPLTVGFFSLLFCLFVMAPEMMSQTPQTKNGKLDERKKAEPAPSPKDFLQEVTLACACMPRDLKLAPSQSVKLSLASLVNLPGATGQATINRKGETTSVELNVSGAPKEVFVYAVSVSGRTVTLLGKLSTSGGKGQGTFQTPVKDFVLAVSTKAGVK